LFGERLVQLDEEDEVVEAFKSFEKPGEEGVVEMEMMRGWLRDYGDKMSDEEVGLDAGVCYQVEGRTPRLIIKPYFSPLVVSTTDRPTLSRTIHEPFRNYLQLSRIRKELESECEW
jgi:hypothetical protein